MSIDGGDWQTPAYSRMFAVTGTAPTGAVVTLFVHKAGTPANDYSIQLTMVAVAGRWSFTLLATTDYRYYASAGAQPSGSVLFQPGATYSGPPSVTVAKNQPYTLRGNAPAGAVVFLHFHLEGTAADDYGIVRSVIANSLGSWERSYNATSDYRIYVSRSADDSASGQETFLLQAR